MIEIQPATRYSLDRLAELSSHGFEGYFVPVAADVGRLAAQIASDQVDLAASFVARDAGVPIGLTLVARRGREARLAGMCVIPSYRGQGVGRAMMGHAIDASRVRGDERLWLEVIEQNTNAVALYTSCGFVSRRRLVGWERSQPALEEGSVALVLGSVNQLGKLVPDGMPWQLQPASLVASLAPAQCWQLDDAYILVAPTPTALIVKMLVVPPGRRRRGVGRRLLEAVARHYGAEQMRIPALVPEGLAEDFLLGLGFARSLLGQFEMELRHD